MSEFESMERRFPRGMRIIVYPNRPQRYDAIVTGHTPTRLRVRVVTEEVKRYRGEYSTVKPDNVIPAP